MSEVKRFYTVSNSAEAKKRGWIRHERECKWFFPLSGVTLVHIEGDATYRLDATTPQVLKVPGGNWFCIEQDGSAEVQVFSNCQVGEFPNDDFRKGLQ